MRRVLPILSVLLLLAPAAHAQTSAQRITLQVARDYQNDGRIDPCRFTTEELQTALDTIGPDTKQYGADFPAAIRAAIAARARGDCEPQSEPQTQVAPPPPPAPTPPTPAPTPTPTAPAVAAATAVPTVTVIAEPPVPDANLALMPPSATTSQDAQTVSAETDNAIPLPMLLLLILGLVAALVALVIWTGRRLGIAEGRFAPAFHAWREASWRATGNWESFRDWVRLGR